jgi:predicted DNA-binding transcriptional regulator YafY
MVQTVKKDYDKTLTRLVNILTKLSNDERPTTKELAHEHNVTVRTIQNDINRLVLHYPITKDENGRFIFEYGYSLKRTTLNSDEMIFLTLALSQFENVDDISKVKESIYKKIVNQKIISPYYIKQDRLEDIDIDSPLVNQIENAITNKEIAKLHCENFHAVVELYKIVAFDGFWYLFAKDIEEKKTKTFLLSEINSLELTGKYHKTSHEKVELLLKQTQSAFFDEGNCFEVLLHVDSDVAFYFKNREFLQSQKLVEENKDGSIVVSFEVSHDEDVDNLIKSWLPHVEVLAPKRFKERILQELKEYIKRVEAK